MADIPIAAASKRKTNHNEMRRNNPSLVLNLILQSYAYFPRRCVQIDGADPCDGKLVGRRIDRAWIFARDRRRQKQFAWKTGGTAARSQPQVRRGGRRLRHQAQYHSPA